MRIGYLGDRMFLQTHAETAEVLSEKEFVRSAVLAGKDLLSPPPERSTVKDQTIIDAIEWIEATDVAE